MQTDLYTKAVLTVIALALSAIALQNFIPLAHAQTSGFRFTPTGALMVTNCDPEYSYENQIYHPNGGFVNCQGPNGNVVSNVRIH